MKVYITLILLFLSSLTWAQQTTTNNTPDTVTKVPEKFKPFERKTTIITLSAGIADWNRQNYKLPDGFTNGMSSGFAPVYLKLERAVSNHVSIAVNLIYDAFYYNYAQEGAGNGTTFLRYQRDNVHTFSGGLIGYYHFTQVRVPNLDLFLGIGATLNRISHDSYPQADSTASYVDRTVSPHLKVGARYYINKYIGLFGDVGYDQISIASIGVACRFY